MQVVVIQSRDIIDILVLTVNYMKPGRKLACFDVFKTQFSFKVFLQCILAHTLPVAKCEITTKILLVQVQEVL